MQSSANRRRLKTCFNTTRCGCWDATASQGYGVLHNGDAQWEGAPPGRVTANSPELLIRLARAGAGIAAVPDYFALPDVRQGALRRVLADWCLPSQTASAVFPGRKLMPAKTRAFIDMLQSALGGVSTATDHPPALTSVA